MPPKVPRFVPKLVAGALIPPNVLVPVKDGNPVVGAAGCNPPNPPVVGAVVVLPNVFVPNEGCCTGAEVPLVLDCVAPKLKVPPVVEGKAERM